MKAFCLAVLVLMIGVIANQTVIARPTQAHIAVTNMSGAAKSTAPELLFTARPTLVPSIASVTRLDAISDLPRGAGAVAPGAADAKMEAATPSASKARKLSEQERAQLRDQVKQMRQKYNESGKPNGLAANVRRH